MTDPCGIDGWNLDVVDALVALEKRSHLLTRVGDDGAAKKEKHCDTNESLTGNVAVGKYVGHENEKETRI